MYMSQGNGIEFSYNGAWITSLGNGGYILNKDNSMYGWGATQGAYPDAAIWNDSGRANLVGVGTDGNGSRQSSGTLLSAILAFNAGPIYSAAIDAGISRLGAASLAIGNGTAGDKTGQITATTHTVAASGAAPTSAGTAGTVGQIIANGGKLYFCSATGAAGAATWNTITLVPIL
jgi:hypothetical protein